MHEENIFKLYNSAMVESLVEMIISRDKVIWQILNKQGPVFVLPPHMTGLGSRWRAKTDTRR